MLSPNVWLGYKFLGKMKTALLKIILLASVSDGEIQAPELSLMNQIKDLHPELRQVSEKEIQER